MVPDDRSRRPRRGSLPVVRPPHERGGVVPRPQEPPRRPGTAADTDYPGRPIRADSGAGLTAVGGPGLAGETGLRRMAWCIDGRARVLRVHHRQGDSGTSQPPTRLALTSHPLGDRRSRSAGADEQLRGAEQPGVPVPGEDALQVAPPPDSGAVRGAETRRRMEGAAPLRRVLPGYLPATAGSQAQRREKSVEIGGESYFRALIPARLRS